MIDSNREEFEKLPIVAKYLPYVFFNKETQGYCNKSDNVVPLDFASFLNGAWYAFQEQQKKLDCCREENKALLDKLNAPDGYKLVPLDPTDIEIESIKEKHWSIRGCQLCKSDYIDLYKAMIGAAP